MEYNEKKWLKTAGKGLKKPTVEQLPLLIRCSCHQHFFSGYESTCPNKYGDGSCELCNCSCKFVVSTSNYYTVCVASMNARKQPRKSDDINNAQEFLNVAAKIQKSAEEDTAEALLMMTRDGRLEYYEEEIAHTVENRPPSSRQSIMSTTPPACGALAGLASKMQVIEHPKGHTWIKMNGMDADHRSGLLFQPQRYSA